jgi:hypothetical protein
VKVLFFMSHPGATRNFESTLRALAERGHQVHLAFDRVEKQRHAGLWDLTNRLVSEYPGITAAEHPHPPASDWSWTSSRVRASVDYLRYLEPEFRDTTKVRRRAARDVPPRIERLVGSAPTAARRGMRAALRLAERSAPLSASVVGYLHERRPDVVLVTPLLELGSIQVEFLRAANRMGIPTCLCVHSWDNLTNKGLVHELPDAITVWNDLQRDEAVRLHGVPAERVVVTGAPAYDHWFGWEPSRSREEFAAAVGLDPGRPFVLYLGSSSFIAPDETAFLVEWVRGLAGHGVEMQVLARPHPLNPLDGATGSNVLVFPAAGQDPTDERSRNDYFDSIYHSSAATGVSTSAFLEAAIVGRPVLTVLDPRHAETQEGTLHFRHLLQAGGGLLHTARDYGDHAHQVAQALAAPHPDGCVSERSKRFTEAFIRPHGLDQPATPLIVDAIEALPARKANGYRSVRRSRIIAGTVLARAARLAVEAEARRRRRARRTPATR